MDGRWLVAAVAASIVFVGCTDGRSGESGPEAADGVRVASFDFAESELIAELYAQVLEAEGVDVVRMGAVGPREVVAPALEQGFVDLVPEYVGTASSYFGAATADIDELTEALADRGLVALQPALAEDVNVFVVTDDVAASHELADVSDLGPLAGTFRIGGPVECPERALCLEGLRSVYGLTFGEFVPHRSLAITAAALVHGEVDVGVMFSTAGELSGGPFVVLRDDRGMQPPEHVVPVLRSEVVARLDPSTIDALDWMSRALTTEALRAMNRRVEDGEPVASTAESWLRSVDLVTN